MPRRLQRSLLRLAEDTRGLTQVEYMVTVGTVAIAIAVAFVLRGEALLADYVNARNLFLVPAI